MPGPKLEPLVLTADERQVLEGWAWRRKTARALVLRSRIVLASADGASVSAVAGELGVTRVTAAKWRSRFLRAGLDGLADEPRPGRPRTIAFEFKPHLARASTPSTSRAADRATPAGSPMLAAERRDLLLARLRRDGKLVAKDLAAELGLSEDSIRRDLRELAADGLCQRVYGGALPASPILGTTHAGRSGIAADSKQRVGKRAAALITPGSTVILDGGTTALEVVAALPPDLDATIVTHSATTAAALASHPTVKVIFLGGHLYKQAVVTSGAVAAEAAIGIAADLALLIMPGVHPDEGLTATVPEDAAMKRILASRAATTYAMVSTEKLGTVMPCKVINFSDVAGIITDASASHPVIQQLRDQAVTILQAP